MDWVFTTRDEGNLATHVGDDGEVVERNRSALSARIGRPIVWMNQMHGDAIAIVDEIAGHTADAQITAAADLALGVLVADCIPLLLWSEQCVAVAHVGRRGVGHDLASKTVTAMRQHFAASEIRAMIGPSVCGNCYEVSAEIHDEIASQWPIASSRTRSSTLALDLQAAVTVQLEGSGVQVQRDGRCTMEDWSLYSHRRDAVAGRFAGVIWR